MADVDPKAIAAFVLVGLASPGLAYVARVLIGWHETRQARKFLERDPLVFEGSKFRKLLTADGVQLMGAGRIAEIEGGRLLAVSSDGSASVPFDVREFKSMYPHWLGADGSETLPAPVPGSAREESYS